MNQVEKGHHYEVMAAAWLEEQGYRILERNYRCRRAEIDIIAEDGQYLVFIEVKYRKGGMQHPLEAVDVHKQRQISQAAAHYLYTHNMTMNQPCRFDVVAILDGQPSLYKDAFDFQYGKGW